MAAEDKTQTRVQPNERMDALLPGGPNLECPFLRHTGSSVSAGTRADTDGARLGVLQGQPPSHTLSDFFLSEPLRVCIP